MKFLQLSLIYKEIKLYISGVWVTKSAPCPDLDEGMSSVHEIYLMMNFKQKRSITKFISIGINFN